MTANTPQVFNNPQFGDIRIVADSNNEPLFCLFDVAKALGYKNPAKAVIDHCKGVSVLETPTNGGIQQMKFGKEGDVYRLILKSKLPDAEKFQDWVCEEVLPSIRKTGTYIVPTSNNPRLQEAEAQLYLIEQISRNLRLNDAGRLGMYQNLAEQHNLTIPAYVQSKGVHRSASDLLKEIGSDLSARKFNGLLAEAGYIEKKTRPSSKGKDKAFWSITLKGEPYGENCVSPNNPNETQPHWYEDRFLDLYSIVTEDNPC